MKLALANLSLAFAAALAACGGNHNAQSLCQVEQPPPAGCGNTCDPTGANTCPAGYFCNALGQCDTDCTPGGNQCPGGQMCTADGRCVDNGSGSGGPDADCPNINFTPSRVTPSIELVLDRSGSMGMNDISPTRYGALHTALTGAMGAITATQGSVYYGAALFSGDETCPPTANLDAPTYAVGRALNNETAIDALISANSPGGNTPTDAWITAVTADFAANPPPMGSPPIILLATDGEPNSCSDNTTNPTPSITAVKTAFTAGIKTFVIGLALSGDQSAIQYLQDIANAGVGKMTGQAPMCASCAPYYTASNASALSAGINSIIGGQVSCNLTINGQVDPMSACSGVVTLNGTTLTCGTDWTVDSTGTMIQLLGSACTTLEGSSNPTVTAEFPCGAVIL